MFCKLYYTNVVNQGGTFAVTETKLYVPAVTLLTQDNAKLLQQLKSGSKRIINWRKYPNLHHLVEPSFQGVNRLFVLASEEDTQRTYENIRNIATGQGDDYTAGCLLDYAYFRDNHKMIAIDLSKQQALDADPRATQQINLSSNLDRANNTRILFILEEAKEIVLDFLQENVEVLQIYNGII